MVQETQFIADYLRERLASRTVRAVASAAGPPTREQLTPHVPVWDKTQRKDETLSSSEFHWDEQAGEYRCPQGHALRSQWRAFKNPRSHLTKADTIIYRSSQSDCALVR